MARRSIIPGLPALSTKADPAPTTGAIQRLFSSARTVRTSGQPYRSNWELERAITDGAQRSIWTFKAIDAIAKTTAMLPIDILQGFDPETAEALPPEHNPMLWRRLNRNANKFEFSIGFRYRLMSQLLLSPRGVFVEVQRDRQGNIHHLFLLNPDKTAPIPDARTFVSGFEVDNNGQLDFIPPENVLWIRIPHPTDPYMSYTPLEAAGLSIDLDYYSRLYNRNFMANDGRPGGLLSIKGPIPEADEEIIKARFTKPTPGQITVVESDGVDFVDLSTTPRDAAYSTLRNEVKTEILVAFGAPESVLGNASGRTYENADAEENIFWRMTNQPLLAFVDMHLGSLTPGGNDDDLWVKHNTRNVRALQRPQRENDQRLLELWREGAIYLDELRKGLGRDEVGRPGSTTFFIPAGKVAISADDIEQEAVAKLVAVGGAGGQPGADPAAQQPQPAPFNRIGAMMAARRAPQALGGTVDTARSPERVSDMRAIEAQSTAARAETKDDKVRDFHCIMLPVSPDRASHLYKASPVPPTEPEPHVTLGIVDAGVDHDLLLDVVTRWAEKTDPFTMHIGPLTTVFENGGDRPFVVDVMSTSLHEARDSLKADLASAGISFTGYGADDYHPHMTLATIAQGVPTPELSEPVAIREPVSQVELSWAEGPTTALRLGS